MGDPDPLDLLRAVLDKIVQELEPGVQNLERDVNVMIQLIHPDYAAIRRYLVDEGFLARAAGVYWRTGGRYELPESAVVDQPTPVVPLTKAAMVLEGVAPSHYIEAGVRYDQLNYGITRAQWADR